jgi:serine/threonine-protein kinase
MQYEDFEILQMIGAGSVGKVYRCRQISLNRMVAIKALRKQHQRDDWVVDSFLREGQVLAGLEHPGIAQIFGMGRFPHGGYFQVVELLEGSNLRERLKNPEPISQESRLRLLGKLAEAIRFAHDQNVIHCDLKPENIMLVGDRVVLTDFGMAQLIKYDHHREILGGTPNYMAPELNDKDPKATAAIDVYAFGKIWDEVNASDSFAEPQALADLRKKCAATLPHERPTAPQLAIALNEHLLRLY